MFYGDGLEDPRRDAELMEQHLAELEKTLGRRLRGKVYWVRGPLLGLGGTAFPGLALGSRSSPDWDALLGGDIDRHELNHAALYQFRRPGADPPLFLDEGWADAQARPLSVPADEHYAGMALYLSKRRRDGEAVGLRQLIGPGWYHNHVGRKHDHHALGAPLVAFLIREYGVERFLSLYNTCREGSFADDCRRVLGTDLDTLERRFSEDVERTAEEMRRLYDAR